MISLILLADFVVYYINHRTNIQTDILYANAKYASDNETIPDYTKEVLEKVFEVINFKSNLYCLPLDFVDFQFPILGEWLCANYHIKDIMYTRHNSIVYWKDNILQMRLGSGQLNREEKRLLKQQQKLFKKKRKKRS